LEPLCSDFPTHFKIALNKLITIGKIATSFLYGELIPQVIAPYRQPEFLFKCNARCIYCPGFFSKEIEYGLQMEEKFIESVFVHPEHIVDFYMSGSELLYYKWWKKVLHYLVSHGINTSISTNGILLTKSNIHYLIDNKLLHYLNISMDGATKETVESIRVNVNFNKLIENIEYLFKYANEQNYRFTLSFSFVLMKRNFQEFPELIKLIKKIKGDNKCVKVEVNCNSLVHIDVDDYIELVAKEHHTLIENDALITTFTEAMEVAKEVKIPVIILSSYLLKDFVRQGCPLPPLVTIKDRTNKVTILENSLLFFKPQDPIKPQLFLYNVNRKKTISISPILEVPITERGKNAKVFAAIISEDNIFVVTSKGPFGSINWIRLSGPLEKCIIRNEIPSFSQVTLMEHLNFNLGLNDISFAKFQGEFDIYFGFSTSSVAPLSNFVGAAFRLVIEQSDR
jgi:sulfatase maturation enzyme AslB (radical SAM superfamily)